MSEGSILSNPLQLKLTKISVARANNHIGKTNAGLGGLRCLKTPMASEGGRKTDYTVTQYTQAPGGWAAHHIRLNNANQQPVRNQPTIKVPPFFPVVYIYGLCQMLAARQCVAYGLSVI